MGNNYRFKVVAVNFAGQGPYSTESQFIIAATYPDPPINVAKLYADRAFITIMWSSPNFDGGSSVFGYKVMWDAGLGATNFVQIADLSHQALIYSRSADIVQGDTYTYKVIAYNAIGDSLPSLPISIIAANSPEEV